jgi:hypothetical protein
MALPTEDESTGDDALMRRLLAALGPRRDPSPTLRRAGELAFRQALAPIVVRRARRRRIALSTAACAAFALIVAVGIGFTSRERRSNPATGAAVAQLVGSVGAVEVLGVGVVSSPATIQAGQALMTADTGRALLRYRGADVRVDVASTVRFGPAVLGLERGAIYVDAGSVRAAGTSGIVIETRFGTLGDVGTQFLAKIDRSRLTVAVREGTVFLMSAQNRHDLTATPREAQIAEVDDSGHLVVHAGPTHGDLWSWVAEVSPEFAVEGRSVDDYLRFLSREHGYALDYRDPSTAARAKAVLLHGDMNGLSLEEAAAAVSATTHLAVVVDAPGTLSVRSEGDHDADPRHDRQ